MKVTTLDNIADGIATELFKHELQKVADNIADVNTGATQKRKITLTFEFTPSENRDEAKVVVASKATLAPVKAYQKTIYCGKNNGKAAIYSQDTKQIDMFDEDVTSLGKKREAAHA